MLFNPVANVCGCIRVVGVNVCAIFTKTANGATNMLATLVVEFFIAICAFALIRFNTLTIHTSWLTQWITFIQRSSSKPITIIAFTSVRSNTFTMQTKCFAYRLTFNRRSISKLIIFVALTTHWFNAFRILTIWLTNRFTFV